MPAELQLDDPAHRKGRRFRALIVALAQLLEGARVAPKRRVEFEDAVGSRGSISAASR